MRAKLLSLLALAIVTALWAVTLPRLAVTTSITHFLPEIADARAAKLAKGIAEGEMSSTLVLDVSGGTPEELVTTTRALLGAMQSWPETRAARSGVDEASQAAVMRLFLERSPTALLGAHDLDDASVEQHLERLRGRLGSPLGPFIRDLARRDPLGGVLDALDRLAEIQGDKVTSRDGVLLTQDETHAFVIATTKASAFDAAAQRAYLARIDETFAKARTTHAIKLTSSGLPKIAVASETQIRGDIERIGFVSTIGILALFAVAFRSLRMLALGLVPLWVGGAAAIVATHHVFGEIHGLTLAFGTSLLGVGIDYAEHYFSHYALTPEEGPARVMRSVWPGLVMGALTTIVGFSSIAFTGFPGVKQIAFFSAVAIAVSLFATRWLLPPWMPTKYTRPRVMFWLEQIAEGALRFAAKRRWVGLVPVFVCLALVPGLLRTRVVDDVSVLLALDPAMMREDTEVRDRLMPADPGRFAVVVDPDEEAAMAALDATSRDLDAARRDGILEGYVPLGAIVRSPASQRASFDVAKARAVRIGEIMAAQGFVPSAFEPFFDSLHAEGPSILTLADVRASPLGGLVAPLSPRLAEGQAFVIPLRGVRDVAALRARLPKAVVIDEVSLLETTYRSVRERTTAMLAVGLGLVLTTLVLRYRSARLVAAALVPALLGAAAALSFEGMRGVRINLLHIVAVLLVLSMGVDYGIFAVEGRGSLKERAHSIVSITTATITTLLSFGLLAFSPSPALQTLGVTITVGLLMSAVLCPLALAFVKEKEPA